MPFDLGSVVPLSVTVTDASGTAANAGSVVLTITLPDQTTETPSVSNPSTGTYTAEYTPTQAGRHIARWVATGANASAYTEVFDVRPAAIVGVISLTDAKNHLNMSLTITKNDAELRDHIEAATRVVEFYVGPVGVREVTEVVSGGGSLILSRTPAISLTSVDPVHTGGLSYAVSDLDLDGATGIVRHLLGWRFVGPLRVVYQAGRAVVAANHQMAARIIVKHLWETQRGGSRRPGMGGQSDDIVEQQLVSVMGFAVPRRAVELLQPDQTAGIA